MTRPSARPMAWVRALQNMALFILGSMAFASGFGTLALHAGLGLALAVGVSWHLALHRANLHGLLGRWLEKGAVRARLRALFHLLFAIDCGALALSGVIVDQIYAPAVTRFHAGAAWTFVGLVGLHLILNARWIGAQLRRFTNWRNSPAPAQSPAGTGTTHP